MNERNEIGSVWEWVSVGGEGKRRGERGQSTLYTCIKTEQWNLLRCVREEGDEGK
jgi:hypothetical protein